MNPATTHTRAYDPRFSFGLVHDVAKVLEAHGYRNVSVDGGQHVELTQHLFHFLHGRERGYDKCHGGVR